MFGCFGKLRKKDIETKKNLDQQQEKQTNQDVDNIDQKLYPQEQYGGNLSGTLNYHIIKIIFSYLDGVGLVQAKQTCQYFNFLIKFNSYKQGSNDELKVQNSQIKKYMEVDLNKIKEQNLIALKVIISQKNKGKASGKYSSFWVTLKLINAQNDKLDHCFDSKTLDEVFIIESHLKNYFVTDTIIISSFQNKNHIDSQFLKHIKEGDYEKLALVIKCQYPGWKCLIQSHPSNSYFWIKIEYFYKSSAQYQNKLLNVLILFCYFNIGKFKIENNQYILEIQDYSHKSYSNLKVTAI